MRDLVLWNMVSVDGFFSAPDGQFDWFTVSPELEDYLREIHQETGTILYGRRTYESMMAYWRDAEGWIADFVNSVPKVVVSRSLETTDWRNTTIIRDDVPGEVAKLKEQPGKAIFVNGSADLSATLIRHGLVDEYRIGLNPVLLGEGVPFFKGGFDRIPLRLVTSRQLGSGLVIHHYRPRA